MILTPNTAPDIFRYVGDPDAEPFMSDEFQGLVTAAFDSLRVDAIDQEGIASEGVVVSARAVRLGASAEFDYINADTGEVIASDVFRRDVGRAIIAHLYADREDIDPRIKGIYGITLGESLGHGVFRASGGQVHIGLIPGRGAPRATTSLPTDRVQVGQS